MGNKDERCMMRRTEDPNNSRELKFGVRSLIALWRRTDFVPFCIDLLGSLTNIVDPRLFITASHLQQRQLLLLLLLRIDRREGRATPSIGSKFTSLSFHNTTHKHYCTTYAKQGAVY